MTLVNIWEGTWVDPIAVLHVFPDPARKSIVVTYYQTANHQPNGLSLPVGDDVNIFAEANRIAGVINEGRKGT